jgi:hypothetical protein
MQYPNEEDSSNHKEKHLEHRYLVLKLFIKIKVRELQFKLMVPHFFLINKKTDQQADVSYHSNEY